MAKYKPHILIVDDNANARELLGDLLRADSYKVHQASSGRNALRAIQRFDPDLVLLDVMMPRMDGFEVCQHLRAQAQTADIPIILLTALNDRDSRMRGFEIGADDFISKPYDRVELRTRIRGITRLNRYRRLVAERAKFEAVVTHSQQATVILSDKGNLQYANAAAELLLGLDSDAVTRDEEFILLVRERFRLEPHLNWGRWPSWPTHPSRKRFLVSRDKDSAETRWLRVDVIAHVPDGNEMVWLLDIKDVTEQVSASRELWDLRRLLAQRLIPRIAELVISLEHLAFAGGLDTTTSRIAKLSLQRARELHGRLNDIVRGTVLAYDRNQAWMPLENLYAAVERAKDEALSSGKQAGASVMVQDNLTEVEGYLSCSDEQLHAMLAELLQNAIIHNRQHAPQIEVTLRQEDREHVVIAVKDDGPGLPEDDLNLAWQPYDLGRKAADHTRALGFGLTIVATIMWEVGGQFILKRGPDDIGTVAELRLPLVAP